MRNDSNNNDENPDRKKTLEIPEFLRTSSLKSLIPKADTTVPSFSSIKPKARIRFVPKSSNFSSANSQYLPNTNPNSLESPSNDSTNLQSILARRLEQKNQGSQNFNLSFNNKQFHPKLVVLDKSSNNLAYVKENDETSIKSYKFHELGIRDQSDLSKIYMYTPLLIPYFSESDDKQSCKKTDVDDQKDVQTQNSCNLFQPNVAGKINWNIIQLPSQLPSLDIEKIENQFNKPIDRTLSAESDLYNANNLNNSKSGAYKYYETNLEQKDPNNPLTSIYDFPEGYIGDFVEYESGRVELVLGENVFEINPSTKVNFYQEASVYLADNSEFLFMGECNSKYIATIQIN